MIKGRALRRALASSDAHRIVHQDLPLIVDKTEIITPDVAYEMLLKNKNNRPINWKKVEEYAAVMAQGKWELHAQGIVLDTDGNILTGQKRLWAVIYSSQEVAMRVSRGNPPGVARLLDRHDPQSARDLATRESGRKHAPTEASLARGILSLKNDFRPSTDTLAKTIEDFSVVFETVLSETKGIKKTKPVLMILAALCSFKKPSEIRAAAGHVEIMAQHLVRALLPQSVDRCWGRGAAFGLAMNIAVRIVKGERL